MHTMPEPAVHSWTSQLSVENAELDAQHITLIEIGRSVVSSIAQDAASEVICDLMEDFVALSKLHDGLEEEILRRNNCPSLAEHQLLHLSSRELFTSYLQQERAQTADRQAISFALSEWMQHHVSENDMKVKDYLKSPA